MAIPTKMASEIRSTYWSVTAFGSEIEILSARIEVPDYVKEIVGGVEECPKTKTLHFQGMVVCRHQVRMSKLKKWLHSAHWERARDKDALRDYAMKADTAVGEKVAWINQSGLHGLCIELANLVYDFLLTEFNDYVDIEWKKYKRSESTEPFESPEFDDYFDALDRTEREWRDEMFVDARKMYLTKKPEDVYRFMNSPFRKLWVETLPIWFKKVRDLRMAAAV